MRVLLDMDGIITNLRDSWFNLYNWEYGTNVTEETCPWYEPSKHPDVEMEPMMEMLHRPGLFDMLRPIDGAIAAVHKLMALGVKVRIATAATNADCARAKIAWAERHLGIDRKLMFICHDKHWIDADVFIDDSPGNLKAWAEHHPDGVAMTINYPWMHEVEDIVGCLANDHKDTNAAWSELVVAIKERRVEIDK